MIRYTVVWHEDALNLLAQIWLQSSERLAVTQSAHTADVELASDPELKGSSVEGELRELIVPPLRILFAASEPDRLVKILHVSTA
jgi:hypothetical protein